jgi:hypothetical protein
MSGYRAGLDAPGLLTSCSRRPLVRTLLAAIVVEFTQPGIVFSGMAVALLHGCGDDDHCEFGAGPWGPANLAGPCDAPPEVRVNALDDGCLVYQCIDEKWSPGVDDRCDYRELLRGDMMEYCPSQCAADLDASTPALESACLGEYVLSPADGAEGDRFSLTECVRDADSWSVPANASMCVGIATGLATDFDAVPLSCSRGGLNLGFVVLTSGDQQVPDGYVLVVGCEWDLSPEKPCPGWDLATPEVDSCAE